MCFYYVFTVRCFHGNQSLFSDPFKEFWPYWRSQVISEHLFQNLLICFQFLGKTPLGGILSLEYRILLGLKSLVEITMKQLIAVFFAWAKFGITVQGAVVFPVQMCPFSWSYSWIYRCQSFQERALVIRVVVWWSYVWLCSIYSSCQCSDMF